MINTIHKDDLNNWSWSDGETLWHEDGSSREILTSDVIFTAGKYVGYKLSEVTDSWYLKFISDKNQKDHFISVMFGRRLKELQ